MPAKAAKTAAKKPVTKRQNVVLARGINAISRNSLARSNGRRNFAKKGGDKKVTSVSKPSTKKWYPADYIPKPLPSAKTARNSVKTAKLRKSIVPGSVLILLSGRFRGKRVVFLKQLESGLLLVTGKPLYPSNLCSSRALHRRVRSDSTQTDRQTDSSTFASSLVPMMQT